MNENRGCNLPSIIFAIAVILGILLCIFSPAILAFIKAGLEDGFTFAAFDLGPSDWWSIGMIALFLGLAVIAGTVYGVSREAHDGRV